MATVLVTPRPAGNPETLALSIIGPVPTPGRVENPSGPGSTRVILRQAMPPMVDISPLAIPSGTPSIGIVGALLTRLNDDMRDALSVKANGLFVIDVQIGTPAGEAGLKSGDVILRADRELVGNPGELIRIMRASDDNSLRLEVIRKRKPQTITLRW